MCTDGGLGGQPDGVPLATWLLERWAGDNLDLVEKLVDGRPRIRCEDCGHEWIRGEAPAPPAPTANTIQAIKGKFPLPEHAGELARARAEVLKADFLKVRPEPEPEVAPYRRRYQFIFSEAGLRAAGPRDLKDFANNSIGAHPGNMSVFNTAWNNMGDDNAADRVRRTIDYLLRGPDTIPEEDRFTHLVDGHKGLGMTGFREALLTRALWVVRPDEFIPIVTYSSEAGGKKEILESVYGLKLHPALGSQWTIGRLVFWSNDLLRQLVGDGFADMQHAAQFLWWAKDQPKL